MALALPFAEATSVGSPALNIAIFAAFVVVTLVIVIRVSSGKKTAEQYYTAAGAFSGRQNGIAIAGDYLSAASFLGIAGAIALQGYDGFLYSIGFLVAWLVALLLVAELMRNTGRFTMADVLSYRLKQRPVRVATAVGATEQPRLSPQGNAAQGSFGGVVRQADAAILEEAGERAPALEHVIHRLGDIVAP